MYYNYFHLSLKNTFLILEVVLLTGCMAPGGITSGRTGAMENVTPSISKNYTDIVCSPPIKITDNEVEDSDPMLSANGKWVFWLVFPRGFVSASDALAFAPSAGGNVSVFTFHELLSAPENVDYSSFDFTPSVSQDGSIAVTVVTKKVNGEYAGDYILVYNRTSGTAVILEEGEKPITEKIMDTYPLAQSVMPLGAAIKKDGSKIVSALEIKTGEQTIIEKLLGYHTNVEYVLVSMNIDGSDLQVVRGGIKGEFFDFRISDDGKKIAYQTDDLWTILPEGIVLPAYVDTFGGFSWTRDGSIIVSAVDSPITIYDGRGSVVARNVGVSTQSADLGVNMNNLHRPSISPDGSRILFYDEPCNLYLMNYDGSSIKKVVDSQEYGEVNGAIWVEVPVSDDGKVFVFSSEYDGDYEVFSVLCEDS